MRLVVNGKSVNIYGAKCTYITKNRDGVFDYTATVRFNANRRLSQHEKERAKDLIEYLIDEKWKEDTP